MHEIELTFLIKEIPEGIKNSPKNEMLDIYLPSNSEHASLRIRKSGEKMEITKKEPVHGTDSSFQLEKTIPLTKDEYSELATIGGKRVEKTRFYYKESGVDYEIDIFKGDLYGLVLVDVEFKSLEEKAKFVKPDWCLVEVTQEKFIAGGMLAGKKYSDIEKDLEKYNYKKISF